MLILSYFLHSSEKYGCSSIVKPMLIAFLKNIRAKDFAITTEIPLALIAIGACSLELPHPKFAPATIISPCFTSDTKLVSISSKQCVASSFGSEVFKYRAGIITSVSTLSPYLQQFPTIGVFIINLHLQF